MPRRAPDRLHGQLAVPVRSRAENHRHMLGRGPAQRGGARQRPLVGLPGQHRVDHQRLQPRVPRAARLRGLRVDLGGREGDLTGVDQQRLPQHRLVAGGRHLLDGRLHDLDGRTDHLHGLAQRDRPGQLAGRGPEDVRADRLRGLRVPEPLREGRDAGLGDQPDPGAVLRGHRPVPRQLLIHPGDGVGGQFAGGLLQPAQGGTVRMRGVSGGFRHGTSLPYSRAVRSGRATVAG